MAVSERQSREKRIPKAGIIICVNLYRNAHPKYSVGCYCAAYVALKPLNNYKKSSNKIRWIITCNGQKRKSGRWSIHEMTQRKATSAPKRHTLFPIKTVEHKPIRMDVEILTADIFKGTMKYTLIFPDPSRNAHSRRDHDDRISYNGTNKSLIRRRKRKRASNHQSCLKEVIQVFNSNKRRKLNVHPHPSQTEQHTADRLREGQRLNHNDSLNGNVRSDDDEISDDATLELCELCNDRKNSNSNYIMKGKEWIGSHKSSCKSCKNMKLYCCDIPKPSQTDGKWDNGDWKMDPTILHEWMMRFRYYKI